MQILVSEKQLPFLVEIAQQKLFDMSEIGTNKIFKRCSVSKSKGIYNSPWCQLTMMYKNELDEKLQKRLLDAIDKLLNVYKKNFDTGVISKIVELSLQDRSRTVNDLELISDFLTNPEYSKDRIKKELTQLKTMPSLEELNALLKMARNKEYVNFENSWDDENFTPQKTKLQFDFRCEKEMDDTFFNLIEKVKIENREISAFVRSFTNCIEKSMSSIQNPIKSDKKLNNDLFVIDNDEKIMVLPKGNYEVKKFDPFIDSYLSEFFSIFKESKLKTKKEEYLDFYNKIVEVIFKWIKEKEKDPSSEPYKFLQKVKDNMHGILFKDNIIVPSKYIKLYWSNKGQMGCKEKRISIRYKLKPEESGNKIEAFIYEKNSDIVKRIEDFKLIDLSDKEEICN